MGLLLATCIHIRSCNFDCTGISFNSLTFFKINFFEKFFQEYLQGVNGLDPDQDRQTVGPDLSPNCLQRFSADDKSHRWHGKN